MQTFHPLDSKFFKRKKNQCVYSTSFYTEYWGLVCSRRAWMKAFRSFSTTTLFSFFPSSRCSWRSQGLQGCWEGLIHFLVVGSSFGVMMITSNLVLLFLFSWSFLPTAASSLEAEAAVLSGHYVGITGAFPLMSLYSS